MNFAFRPVCLLVIAFALAGRSDAAFIDFEDLAQPAGSNTVGGDVISRGFLFDINTDHSHLVNNNFSSFNGTTWLGLDDTNGRHSLLMSSVTKAIFSLTQADFSEFFTDDNGQARTVVVTGNFALGGTITKTVTLDQIADGSGPLNDFQTETFSAAWTGLASVQFVGNGGTNNWWALDNVGVLTNSSVPEPSSFALCGIAGAAGIAGARLRRGRTA